MIQSFRNHDLQRLWEDGKPLPHKTLIAGNILRVLDLIVAASAPYDVAFYGIRFDEWPQDATQRYGVMVTDHWLISFAWRDGDAIEIDLERLD